MSDTELLLPPWPKKRRILATLVMSGFILTASVCMGIGVYQIALSLHLVRQPITKESVAEALLKDRNFAQTMRYEAQSRPCDNTFYGISIRYQTPFRPTVAKDKDACLTFVALHPTGGDSVVTLVKKPVSREELMSEYAKEFESVTANVLAGTTFETGKLWGTRHGLPAVIYVIKTGISTSWVVIYSPSSPTTEKIVETMVEHFSLL